MNLLNKKELAARTLNVGKNRIIFNQEGLSEIKEAITKQDIKTLYQEGIITIRPVKGRRKIEKRKTRKGPGKIKKKINHRKQNYVKITRKLRKIVKELRNKGEIDKEKYLDLRNKIRMSTFRSKAHFKEYLEDLDIKVEGKIRNLKIEKEERRMKKPIKKSESKTKLTKQGDKNETEQKKKTGK